MPNYIVVNLDDIEDAEITEVLTGAEYRTSNGAIARVWRDYHHNEWGYWCGFTNVGAGYEQTRFNDSQWGDARVAFAHACDHGTRVLAQYEKRRQVGSRVQAQLREHDA